MCFLSKKPFCKDCKDIKAKYRKNSPQNEKKSTAIFQIVENFLIKNCR